ncbi:hypothetical protein ACIPW5_04930 [Streptomyces sp. NPDC090077]|uniref:hypothetical protein n=1 Tax=Streptomyces sp. NPDC090077 TaxID=3365938 RepID=UPI0038249EFC
MHRGTGLLTRHGLAVLTAAAVLTGCGSAGPKDDSPAGAAPSASAPHTPPAAGATRDTVEADVVAALRKAGIDPSSGGSTTTRNGTKRPDMFDWMGTVKTPEAGPALAAVGPELERLGWQKVPASDSVLRYQKGDWKLLLAAMGSDAISALQEGDSMISLTVTKFEP